MLAFPFLLATMAGMAGMAAVSENPFPSNSAEQESEQYTVKQASEMLNVSELTVKRRIKKGELKADIVDGKYIISGENLFRFMGNTPGFQPKGNSTAKEKIAAYDSQELITKLRDEMGKNPGKCQDLIKRCELSKQIKDLELQLIELDKKILKDDTNALKKLDEKKYNCEFEKVQADNDINTLKFMLYKANREEHETAKK